MGSRDARAPHRFAPLEAGGPGLVAANKAQAIYANSVETKDAAKVALFEEVMKRAEAQALRRNHGQQYDN